MSEPPRTPDNPLDRTGSVVSYDRNEGFGFIRADSEQESVAQYVDERARTGQMVMFRQEAVRSEEPLLAGMLVRYAVDEIPRESESDELWTLATGVEPLEPEMEEVAEDEMVEVAGGDAAEAAFPSGDDYDYDWETSQQGEAESAW